MRFAIAASILTQADPIAFAETASGNGRTIHQDFSGGDEFRKSFSLGPRLQHQSVSRLSRASFEPVRNKLARQVILKNSSQKKVECDPTSIDADVGILSCPADQSFCMSDSSSSLGGICVRSLPESNTRILSSDLELPLRRGFIYCDPASPYYGILSCECDQFSLYENEGSFKCTYDSYCFGEISKCCADACAEITFTYSSAGSNTYSYETCYSFQTPYQQTFCYGRNVDRNDKTTSCFGSFDGQGCDSCQTASADCTIFNCSSAPGLEAAFCLEDFYPPILASCYAECSTCTICPNIPGGSVTNPDAFISFTDLTCGYMDFLGSLGFLGGSTNETCLDVVSAVEKACCEHDEVVPEQPNSSPPSAIEAAKTLSPSASPTSLSAWGPVASPDASFEDPSPSASCNIRIQTSKCSELLAAQSEVIPCDCSGKCIAFVNDKFQKCDGGTNIAGSGTLVAGCTFEMAFPGSFKCAEPSVQDESASIAPEFSISGQKMMFLLSLPLYFLISFF